MYKVGQKVRVTKDQKTEDGLGWYKKGEILTVAGLDTLGRPYFVGESCYGWVNAHRWTTPIATPEPEIEVTQIRYLGRLYNLVPVEE